MNLQTVFITHNRLELTKQALASYLETVDIPHSVWIADNGSSDGTQEWVTEQFQNKIIDGYVLLKENQYPGYACNRAWEKAPLEADFLHRADNDWAFLPGWTRAVELAFRDQAVGQVGLRTEEEEQGNTINVGGNCVVRKTLWNQGLRYDERPWTQYPPTFSEDAFFSPEVLKMGYKWVRVKRPCIVALENPDWNDPYYQRSFGDRKIAPE